MPFNAVAYADSSPCGIVSGTEPEAGAVELISLWVAPQARGLGAGDALVKAVIAFARQQRATEICLSVRESNAHAAALYRRHGFVDCGRTGEAGEPPERTMTLQLA